MTTQQHYYVAIDAKSFYASVECVDRGLDPLTTHLVVADMERTEKTICLAVTPSLKQIGIPGRPRLFEVIQKVEEENRRRLREAIRQKKALWQDGKYQFAASSFNATALHEDSSLEMDYIVAPPRMARYLEISEKIYNIYMKFVAPEDLHPYSCDEVFIDVTPYLKTYRTTPHELAMTMIREVLYETGITATAGIGTNLYLAKIAMDIVAKKSAPDKDGVRIAELDERTYREKLWTHRPLTSFWRIGPATARKLESRMVYTMGDLARLSTYDQPWLYKTFGINAELLIDHAWGLESCTMADIKRYRPSTTSVSEGQVLACPTPTNTARILIAEMADNLVYQLTKSGFLTDSLTVDLGYDRVTDSYTGPITYDRYGRATPKRVHGSIRLDPPTNLGSRVIAGILQVFDRIADPQLMLKRLNVCAGRLIKDDGIYQVDMFSNTAESDRERSLQRAMLSIKEKYGRNAAVRGISYLEGATARERNGMLGGHRAGEAGPNGIYLDSGAIDDIVSREGGEAD